MNIQELLERSKTSHELDPDKLNCINDNDPLVIVQAMTSLALEPIWEKPIDEREGPIYLQYVKDNPNYCDLLLRNQVAERLYAAADSMPKHLKLILRDAHRPVAIQLELLQSLINKYLTDNLGAKIEDAIEYARTFVIDPKVTLPPHCCGTSVDIDVQDTRTGLLADLGCPVNTPSEISYLHSSLINKEQYATRMILLTAMLKAGFAPNYYEWWHFSYGDTVWAYFYDKKESLYGIIEPQ